MCKHDLNHHEKTPIFLELQRKVARMTTVVISKPSSHRMVRDRCDTDDLERLFRRRGWKYYTMFMPGASGASKVRWQCIVCLPHCIIGCSVSPLVLQHFHHRRISCIVSGVGVVGHMRGAKKQVSQLIASPLRKTSHRIARITCCSV